MYFKVHRVIKEYVGGIPTNVDLIIVLVILSSRIFLIEIPRVLLIVV
jgi:hypothetical protein